MEDPYWLVIGPIYGLLVAVIEGWDKPAPVKEQAFLVASFLMVGLAFWVGRVRAAQFL